MRARRRQRQRGFTLIELMISLVLFSLVVAGMLSVAVSMSSGFREQQMAVETESSARSSMDFIAEALRGASPGVPISNIQHVNTCATGAFSITNSATAPDQLTMVFASGAVVTSLRTAYQAGTTAITVTDATQLAIGDTLLVTDLDQGHLMQVVSVNAGTGFVGLAAQSCGTLALPVAGYTPGSLVIRVLRATLSVGLIDGIPTLLMDPDAEGPATAEPLAEGVEDMQIAVGIDGNGDGTISELGGVAGDDEWIFNVAGEVQPAGVVRGVRITLIARATNPVVGNTTYKRPGSEDRPIAGVTDAFRRRALTSMIEVRNLGGSP